MPARVLSRRNASNAVHANATPRAFETAAAMVRAGAEPERAAFRAAGSEEATMSDAIIGTELSNGAAGALDGGDANGNGHGYGYSQTALDAGFPVSGFAEVKPLEMPGDRTLEEIERDTIVATLQRFNGHRQRTAKALGIGVRTLGLKLKKWKDESLVSANL